MADKGVALGSDLSFFCVMTERTESYPIPDSDGICRGAGEHGVHARTAYTVVHKLT